MVTVPEQLQKLVAMLDEGYITREEFDTQKKELLLSGSHPDRPLPAQDMPERVGAYQVHEVIGQGGMGVVYGGRHRNDTIAERQGGGVAIKVLYPQYAANKRFQERFEREVTMGLKLNHPNIVGVHDMVIDGSTLALVMERVEGEELSTLIGDVTGPVPWARARPMVDQLLGAIEHVHATGLIHRDIKPENVLVQKDGQLKLLDMGIAKDLETNKTKAGTGMGTVAYMAPEQYTDASSVDFRADIYALGFLLYEMVAGQLPWDAELPEFEILKRKNEGDIPPPTDFYPDIPKTVVDAIRVALQIDPDARYSSIGDLRKDLARSPSSIPGEVAWDLGSAPKRSSAKSSREKAAAGSKASTATLTKPTKPPRKPMDKSTLVKVAGAAVTVLIVLPSLLCGGGLWLMGGDARACIAAEEQDTLEVWESYTEDRSDGECIQRARARVRRLRSTATTNEADQAASEDAEACEEAGIVGTHSSWKSYLNTYPTGKCQRLANAEVKRLPPETAPAL